MSTRTTRPARRRTSRARTSGSDALPSLPAYERGNALTPIVHFTDKSRVRWLVYIESGPSEPALWPNAAIIPGRRLRFDSTDRSLAVGSPPAGAPYLSEERLQALLDRAQAIGNEEPVDEPAPATDWRSVFGRLVQPAALALIVLRDIVLPRERG